MSELHKIKTFQQFSIEYVWICLMEKKKAKKILNFTYNEICQLYMTLLISLKYLALCSNISSICYAHHGNQCYSIYYFVLVGNRKNLESLHSHDLND